MDPPGRTSLGQSCCKALIRLLGVNALIFPGTADYNTSLSSYFTPQASSVLPLCFVTPHTVADVSAVVKSLTSNGDSSCNFAVRSGGHLWFPDASNIANGVTVDLRGLDSIQVSADRSSVAVGVGATWDTVYAKLDPLGLSVAGGRVGGVGVGGLTLGGGISYFGPRYGWTGNQATLFEVVLANGSVVQASQRQNSDLWWGLRGGSNNLGVVTRINFSTFRQGLLWSILTINPLSVVRDQARIFSQLAAAGNYDENASFLFGWAYSASQGGLMAALNQLVYTKVPAGTQTESPKFYREILKLPPMFEATAAVANMTTLAKEAESGQPPQVNRFLAVTTTFVPIEAMIIAAYDAWNSSLTSMRRVEGINWILNIEPVPPQMYRQGAADNALGLADRKRTLAVCLLSPTWPNQAQDEVVYAGARALMEDIEKRAKKLGVHDEYIYLNYAAPWQDPISSYGKASVKRLKKLRAKVDPHGVFTRRVPGGFKIPL